MPSGDQVAVTAVSSSVNADRSRASIMGPPGDAKNSENSSLKYYGLSRPTSYRSRAAEFVCEIPMKWFTCIVYLLPPILRGYGSDGTDLTAQLAASTDLSLRTNGLISRSGRKLGARPTRSVDLRLSFAVLLPRFYVDIEQLTDSSGFACSIR